MGSEKEMGSLRLLVIQLAQTIAEECPSHQDTVGSSCVIQLVAEREDVGMDWTPRAQPPPSEA